MNSVAFNEVNEVIVTIGDQVQKSFEIEDKGDSALFITEVLEVAKEFIADRFKVIDEEKNTNFSKCFLNTYNTIEKKFETFIMDIQDEEKAKNALYEYTSIKLGTIIYELEKLKNIEFMLDNPHKFGTYLQKVKSIELLKYANDNPNVKKNGFTSMVYKRYDDIIHKKDNLEDEVSFYELYFLYENQIINLKTEGSYDNLLNTENSIYELLVDYDYNYSKNILSCF